MAIPASEPAPAVEQVNGSKANGAEKLEAGMSKLAVNGEQPQQQQHGQDFELHRWCAEGNVEEVRGVLSRGLEQLETLDLSSGCTPIVLAIRYNHGEVVRELLSAGAIVPPPGLTSDPAMLALLYPQPVYGMPPYGQPQHQHQHQHQPMGMAPDFYPQQFYPGPSPDGRFPHPHSHSRKESMSNAQQPPANLPPAEVSKTIPCRNFPNCKYGNSCVFFHPSGRPAPFFPPPPPNGYMSNGFDGQFSPSQFQSQPYFVPNGYAQPPFANGAPPAPETTQQSCEAQENGTPSVEEQTTTSADAGSAPVPAPAPSQAPSAIAPIFVPAFPPGPNGLASPPPHSQYGMSPLSPSMLAGSLPSIPPAEAFFAQSPTNGSFVPPPTGPGFAPNRRQSFGQGFQPGMKPYHGKKPSFSGGPRPFGRASMGGSGANPNLGSWKDGNPPPCAFFAQSKCRNGEFCKFPHIDEAGNDVRHPDVVRGVLAPLPSLASRQRSMRMSNGGHGFVPFDPNFRPQMAYPAPQAAQETIPEHAVNVADEQQSNGVEGSAAPAADKPALPSSVPAKPAHVAAPAAPLPQVVRSASQPGVQRVHVNGFNSRSHSPAPSNVSFHGNGHPRRGGARVPFPGPRSSSQGESRVPNQRVPGADDFPALGGSTQTSPNPNNVPNGKTAAQVLSAPAPAPPKPEPVVSQDDAQSVRSDGSVSMESESDSDAVIISHKPSPAPTASASPLKRAAPLSFAKAISTAPEAAPVGVQA